MATDIVMPNLGFDTQSGLIIEWYVQPGEAIAKGEAIALVEADKSNVELESIAAGIVIELLVETNKEIAVGTVIARVGTPEELQTTSENTRVSPLAERVARDKGVNIADVVGSGNRGRIMRRDIDAHLENGSDNIPMALPKVRKLARETGINLSDLGITDRPITVADLKVLQTAPTAQTLPETQPEQKALHEGATGTPLSRIRQRIASRLVSSKQEAPHFYVTGEFDLSDAIDRLKNYKAGLNDLLQFLTIQALLQVPELNGHFENDTVYSYENVHLSVAVALDTGLVTPTIPNADHYSLNGLAQVGRDLIQRTRASKLTPEDTQVGTFTISNLGVVKQVDHFTAIINPPQIAILAVGTVKPRPVIINDGFYARTTVNLTLSGDHRVVDGMDLARFMKAFQDALDRFS
ncbi:MAG: dihydrolipoamide acetyltransferase family protein [Aggregatilineales bacterium]